jgi:hypothetical protein
MEERQVRDPLRPEFLTCLSAGASLEVVIPAAKSLMCFASWPKLFPACRGRRSETIRNQSDCSA